MKAFYVFEMAAVMSFPCNGILLIHGSLPRIFPISTLRQASFPIPISNYLIRNVPALRFNLKDKIKNHFFRIEKYIFLILSTSTTSSFLGRRRPDCSFPVGRR